MSQKLSLLGVFFCITLCVKGIYGFRWGDSTPEDLPKNGYSVGTDNEDGPVYVIRAAFQNVTLPGKYTLFNRRATVSLDGKEHTVSNYEFLLDFKGTLSDNQGGVGIPDGAVVGGDNGYGESFNICVTFKGENKDEACVGRLQPNDKLCYFGYDGEEYIEDVYYIVASYS